MNFNYGGLANVILKGPFNYLTDFLEFSIFGKGSSINHVDRYLDTFDPFPLCRPFSKPHHPAGIITWFMTDPLHLP